MQQFLAVPTGAETCGPVIHDARTARSSSPCSTRARTARRPPSSRSSPTTSRGPAPAARRVRRPAAHRRAGDPPLRLVGRVGRVTPGPPLVRHARPDEAAAISDLALRSKGHWGYSAEFLEACRDELTVSAAWCEAGTVLVAVDESDDGVLLGFVALSASHPTASWPTVRGAGRHWPPVVCLLPAPRSTWRPARDPRACTSTPTPTRRRSTPRPAPEGGGERQRLHPRPRAAADGAGGDRATVARVGGDPAAQVGGDRGSNGTSAHAVAGSPPTRVRGGRVTAGRGARPEDSRTTSWVGSTRVGGWLAGRAGAAPPRPPGRRRPRCARPGW